MNFIQWGFATSSFAWFTRRLTPWLMLPAAIAVIAAVGILLQLTLSASGLTVNHLNP